MPDRLDAADVYRWHRERLLRLAPELTDEQLDTTVPACPAWTVRELYAHLAAGSTEVLSGALTEMPTPEHTQRQVDERSDHSLSEVCDEWETNGPKMDELLRAVPIKEAALDAWSHYNDIRGALGLPRDGDEAVLSFALGVLASGRRRRWPELGLPTLRVVGSQREWLFGDGEPAATVAADDYELARLFIGRRSPAQLRAIDWQGDPTPFVGHLSVFPVPEDDLRD
jgi:uncharacterized protein (TIGR03083 family)